MKHWIRFLPWVEKYPKLEKIATALESLYSQPGLIQDKVRYNIEEKVTEQVTDMYNCEIVAKAKDLADRENIKHTLHHHSIHN